MRSREARYRQRGHGLDRLARDVADDLQRWVEETDVDGFNLAYALTHESFADFVDLVVPELQRRGVYKTGYANGTLAQGVARRLAAGAAPAPGLRRLPEPAVGAAQL